MAFGNITAPEPPNPAFLLFRLNIAEMGLSLSPRRLSLFRKGTEALLVVLRQLSSRRYLLGEGSTRPRRYAS